MKTREQIIRKMKALSKEFDYEMEAYFNMKNKSDDKSAEYRSNLLVALRELAWVMGYKQDKFIKTGKR